MRTRHRLCAYCIYSAGMSQQPDGDRLIPRLVVCVQPGTELGDVEDGENQSRDESP